MKDTILEYLSDERIFDLEVSADKHAVKITEACDYYFDAILTKDQLAALIDELKAIHAVLRHPQPRGEEVK